MSLTFEQVKILAECSVRDGEQRYTEDDIRDMVGSPSIEDNYCLCGLPLDKPGPDCSSHMSQGY